MGLASHTRDTWPVQPPKIEDSEVDRCRQLHELRSDAGTPMDGVEDVQYVKACSSKVISLAVLKPTILLSSSHVTE